MRRPPIVGHRFATVEAAMLIAPGLKVGLGAARQIILPGRLERHAGLGERIRRAAKLIAGTRIKAARPFPLRDRVPQGDGARDGPDMDVAVVDVPTVAAVRIGSSGQFGHERI